MLSLPHRHVQWGFLAFQKCIQAFRSAEKQNGHQGEEADLIKKQRMRDGGGEGGGGDRQGIAGIFQVSSVFPAEDKKRASFFYNLVALCFNQEQRRTTSVSE